MDTAEANDILGLRDARLKSLKQLPSLSDFPGASARLSPGGDASGTGVPGSLAGAAQSGDPSSMPMGGVGSQGVLQAALQGAAGNAQGNFQGNPGGNPQGGLQNPNAARPSRADLMAQRLGDEFADGELPDAGFDFPVKVSMPGADGWLEQYGHGGDDGRGNFEGSGDGQGGGKDSRMKPGQIGRGEPEQPKTFLDLSEERKQWLLQRALDRIDDCRTSMGLEFGIGEAQHGSWAWYREMAMQGYNGNYDWRAAYGGVFMENNWSLNVPKRFIRLMTAKVCADLLGTEPYFAAMPEKGPKAELAKAVEKYVQRKIAASNLSQVLREAVRVAITTGERAVKIAHVTDKTGYKGPAVVAVDRRGKPLRTAGGDYIFPKDGLIADPDTQGQWRLEKDPGFVINAQSHFIDPVTGRFNYKRVESLSQTLLHKDGLEAGGLATQDFLYPIEVPSLDKADIMVHVYDEAQENLERLYPWQSVRLPDSDSGALSAASQPNDEQGEQERWVRPRARPLVNVHETYIRCDADEDGREEWIFAIIDYKNRELIYAEYLGAMNLKRPPFALLRGVESVPGRAYGAGIYKMFLDKNLFIDVQFNRVALKSSKDGSITFVHKDGTEETKAGLTVTVGDKKQYTIPANSLYGKERPPVFRINLNEVDEFGFQLLEKVIQTGMLEFGIVSAADGAETDLNASGTATGVRNIERTGNLLHRMTEDLIAGDIEQILDLASDIVIENMRPVEALYDADTEALMKLNREEIRLLRRDVRLLLTKVRSEEAIEASTQVVQLLDAYYGRPMRMRKIVRPEYIKLLKNLDVQDADECLEEPGDDEIAQEEQQKQQAQQAALKAGESMKIDPSMLLPSELAQALQNMGITPDPQRNAQQAGAPAAGQAQMQG